MAMGSQPSNSFLLLTEAAPGEEKGGCLNSPALMLCLYTRLQNTLPVDRETLWFQKCRKLSAATSLQGGLAPRREVRPVGPTCRAERKEGEAQGS